MGVDAATHRIRIGCFRHNIGNDVITIQVTINVKKTTSLLWLLTNCICLIALMNLIMYLLLTNIHLLERGQTMAAICILYTAWEMNYKRNGQIIDGNIGIFWYINILLLAAGIEPNPGPDSAGNSKELVCRWLQTYFIAFAVNLITFLTSPVERTKTNQDVKDVQFLCSFEADCNTVHNSEPHSSYLLGNKGAHMVNGNPHSEGDTTLSTHTASLLERGVADSIGFITITAKSDYSDDETRTCTGTGFRVGESHFMTAYHVFREKINKLLQNIIYCSPECSPDLLNTLQLEDQGTGMSKQIAINEFIAKNGLDIPLLLKHLGSNVTDIVSSIMNGQWERDCKVEFVNHEIFTVGWHIPFGHEDTDIVILPLIKTNQEQDFPKPLFLKETFDEHDLYHIVRYITEGNPRIVLDTACKVYTDDEQLAKEVNSAIQWWTSLFPDETNKITYARCLKAHDEETGLVILKAAASFVYGSSGAPIVYLKSGQPFAGMIYQGGFPTFYYKEQDEYNKKIKEKTKKEIDHQVLFERCTTMKKLAELLSFYNKLDLKKEIFSENLLKRHILKDKVRDGIRSNYRLESLFGEMESAENKNLGLSGFLEILGCYVEPTEYMKRIVTQWKKDDEIFITTPASKHICKEVENSNILTIVGTSGSGKSYCMQHAALKLQRLGYSLFIITDCSEIKQFIKPGSKNQLFLVDDPIGEDNIDIQKLQEWRNHGQYFKAIFKESVKLLVTTRTEIMNSLGNSDTVFNIKTINMHSKELEMTPDDKDNYFQKICSKRNIEVSSDDPVKKMVTECELQNFPLLVHMYSTDEYFRTHPYDLFVEPLGAFETRLERMWEKNDAQFGGLVLCAFLQDQLPIGIFDPFVDKFSHQNKKVNDLLKNLSIECKLELVGKEIEKLKGVYINKTKSHFVFRHSAFKNVVLYVVAKRHHGFILDHCDTEFCLDRCCLSRSQKTLTPPLLKQSEDKYRIEVKEYVEDGLASKFITTLKSQNNLTIKTFSSSFCHDELFLQHMVSEIEIQMEEEQFKSQVLYQMLCNACLIKAVDIRDKLISGFNEFSSPCFTGLTPLIACTYAGDINQIKLLLSKHCDVNVLGTGSYETTTLCVASKLGHLQIVKLFLDHGANINTCDGTGRTPLTLSIDNDKNDVMHLLLERNADVDMSGFKTTAETPLVVASKKRSSYITNILLEKKADVDKLDGFGISPMAWAIHGNHSGCSPITQAVFENQIDAVQTLLEQNADVNICGDKEESYTPLGAACFKGYKDIIHLLLSNNADINRMDGVGRTPITRAVHESHIDVVELLLSNNADVNICGDKEQSDLPLGVACNKGNVDIVYLLLSHNADVDKLDGGGRTSITRAVHENHLDVVQILLDHNADVNICGDKEESDTPLSAACYNGHEEIIYLLLKHNADINKLDGMGLTPITSSVFGKHIDVTKILLDKNADVNLFDDKKQTITPLGAACYKGYGNIVYLLVNHNANIDQFDGMGVAPITQAVFGNHIGIVKMLLDQNADVNLHDDKKLTITALGAASYKGNEDMIYLLLSHNADVDELDGMGITPITWAVWGNHIDIMKILLRKSVDIDLCGDKSKSITALGAACYKGSVDMVHLLLSYKADIDKLDGGGRSPLTLAVRAKNIDIVQILLERNAKVDMFCHKICFIASLCAAGEKGFMYMIRELLSNNIGIHIFDGVDRLPVGKYILLLLRDDVPNRGRKSERRKFLKHPQNKNTICSIL